ncbi:hypothetical protein H101_02796 [Trichophyton interdigitale H6]|nr:hypothetical protein H101_02796 [Trichophyton interdigitale H6]
MSFSRKLFAREACAADAYPLPPSTVSSRSSRKRRTEGSSESEGGPFLGDTTIYNQDYRCGGPHLVELPATTQLSSSQNPIHAIWSNELQAPVLEILDKFNVDFNPRAGVYPVQRASEEDVEEVWHDTIFISATKHSLDRSWYLVCKEIRKLLEEKNMSHFNVEIIDSRASVFPRAFPIDPEDPFVEQWPPIQATIIEMLGDRHWTVLQPLLLGQPDTFWGPRTMTVSLTVRLESTCDWTEVREAIIQMLDSRGLHHVAVIIYRESVLHALPDFRILKKRDWELATVFGGSIGLRDSNASPGTFGGYVELQSEDGSWRKYGITNYHCIRENLPDPEKCDKMGVCPMDAQANPILVDQPSLKYHEQSIQSYLNDIEEMDNSISPAVKNMIKSGDSSVPKGKVRTYEMNQEIISSTTALIDHGTQFFKEKSYRLGKVHAASGFRVTDQRHLVDWALIEVREERLGGNNVGSSSVDCALAMEFANLGQIPQNSNSGLPQRVRNSYMPEETFISGTSKIEEGMPVFKLGNCTGFTAGQVNGTKEASFKHWMKNEDGEWTSILGRCYSVAPRACSAFGDAGDSGSLVLSDDGKLVGLYFAGDRDLGWGLFIGWNDIFNDIKDITGLNVRVPSS